MRRASALALYCDLHAHTHTHIRAEWGANRLSTLRLICGLATRCRCRCLKSPSFDSFIAINYLYIQLFFLLVRGGVCFLFLCSALPPATLHSLPAAMILNRVRVECNCLCCCQVNEAEPNKCAGSGSGSGRANYVCLPAWLAVSQIVATALWQAAREGERARPAVYNSTINQT